MRRLVVCGAAAEVAAWRQLAHFPGPCEHGEVGDIDIHASLERYALKGPDAFRKVVSGRKLWNYDRKELDAWKAAF